MNLNPEWIAQEAERLISAIRGLGIMSFSVGVYIMVAALIIKSGLRDIAKAIRGKETT